MFSFFKRKKFERTPFVRKEFIRNPPATSLVAQTSTYDSEIVTRPYETRREEIYDSTADRVADTLATIAVLDTLSSSYDSSPSYDSSSFSGGGGDFGGGGSSGSWDSGSSYDSSSSSDSGSW